MRLKNLKLLGIILLVLVGLLAFKIYSPQLSSQISPYKEKISGVKRVSVQTIAISKGTDTVTLAKEQDVWRANGKKADKSKIDELLTLLLPETSPEIVAQTDKRHKEFELTSDLATKITLNDNTKLLLGKSSYPSIYARFDGQNDVFSLKGSALISATVTDWYDKTIFTVDQTKISKMIFTNENGLLSLMKRDNKWMIESANKEAKKDKVDGVLTALTNLTAQSVADKEFLGNYPTSPTLTLTVEYDGKKETLEFTKGESDYLVKRQSDGENYIVAEYTVSNLASAPQDVQ